MPVARGANFTVGHKSHEDTINIPINSRAPRRPVITSHGLQFYAFLLLFVNFIGRISYTVIFVVL